MLVLVLHQEGAGKSKTEKAEASAGDEVLPAVANQSAAAGGESDSRGPDARTVFTGELVSCAAGEYHFTYTLQEAGNYTLSVMVGKDKMLVGGRPLGIEALPGALSSQHCGVVGMRLGSGTLLYGSSATFSLYLRDSFGNYISCAHYSLCRYPSPRRTCSYPSLACAALSRLVILASPQMHFAAKDVQTANAALVRRQGTSTPPAAGLWEAGHKADRLAGAAGRGLLKHNISRVSIYHEPGDDAPAAWSTLGRLGRCHDSVYHETFSDKIDGVLDVSFTVPHRNMSGESTKELSLDLEARVSTCVSV